MYYSTPTLIMFNGISAKGDALACFPGTSVVGYLCTTGPSDSYCNGGTGGAVFGGDCGNGNATAGMSCVTGGVAGFECADGSGAAASGACSTGPSV